MLTDNLENATVLLCDTKTDNRINKGYLPVDFIVDCVKKNTFLDIEKYRQDTLGLKPSTSKEYSDISDSESLEEDNAIKFTESSRIRVQKRDMAGRKKYSHNDDIKIIKHLIHHDNYSQSGGNTVWKMMESVKVTDHTYQSMKARFHKIIIPNIDSYDIPAEWKKKLTGVEDSEEIEETEDPSFSNIDDWKNQLRQLRHKKDPLRASENQEDTVQCNSRGSFTKSPTKRNQNDASHNSETDDGNEQSIPKNNHGKSNKLKLNSLHTRFSESTPKKMKAARLQRENNCGTNHSDDGEDVSASDNFPEFRRNNPRKKNPSSFAKKSVNKGHCVESESDTSCCQSSNVHEPDDPCKLSGENDVSAQTGSNPSGFISGKTKENVPSENINGDIETDQEIDLDSDIESDDEIDKKINKVVATFKQKGNLVANSAREKESKAQISFRTESSATEDVPNEMENSVNDGDRLSPEIEFVAEPLHLQNRPQPMKIPKGNRQHHPKQLLIDIEYLIQRFGVTEEEAAYLLKVRRGDIVATLQFLQA